MGGGKGNIKPTDAKPFVKGDPRINRKGRPRKLPDLNILLIQVLGEKREDKTAMEMILIALRQRAMKGDFRATQLLLDRAYGPVRQSADIDLNFDISRMSDEDLTKLLERLTTKDNVKKD